MSDVTGKTFVVVGARGGLGREIATQLAQRGASVIGTARSESSFGEMIGYTSRQLSLDLNDPRSVADFIDDLTSGPVGIDGLVLAAGIVAFGPAAETSSATLSDLMTVNATAQLAIVTGLASTLARSGDAVVVSLSGKVAEIPTAGIAAYSASKAALHAFSVAAGRELRRSNIRWVDARPGHTETGLASRAVAGTAPDFGAGLTPAAVATRIVEAIVNDEKDLPSAAFEN
ncbi:MAG: SDR family NAD(P)-dependent oxidoreductase [Actinobacteria bacterium]|nr:SDR family NAD(P)-dependent oxidoreductase [Actinomycetota bacterium]